MLEVIIKFLFYILFTKLNHSYKLIPKVLNKKIKECKRNSVLGVLVVSWMLRITCKLGLQFFLVLPQISEFFAVDTDK